MVRVEAIKKFNLKRKNNFSHRDDVIVKVLQT